jgi:hypothetical protein
MKPYYATKKDGKFTIHQSEELKKQWQNLKDGTYKIETTKAGSRSGQANRYYHAAIVDTCMKCLINDWGDVIETSMGVVSVNHDFAHEWLLAKFNTDKVVNDEGEEMTVTFRTSKGEGNKKDHFGAYVERCRQGIFLQWGVHCPEAGEQLEIK